jgi:hypothetical protein
MVSYIQQRSQLVLNGRVYNVFKVQAYPRGSFAHCKSQSRPEPKPRWRLSHLAVPTGCHYALGAPLRGLSRSRGNESLLKRTESNPGFEVLSGAHHRGRCVVYFWERRDMHQPWRLHKAGEHLLPVSDVDLGNTLTNNKKFFQS